MPAPVRTGADGLLDGLRTEEVVPEIPFIEETAVDLIGPNVARYQYDENSSEAALAHAALDSSAVS